MIKLPKNILGEHLEEFLLISLRKILEQFLKKTSGGNLWEVQVYLLKFCIKIVGTISKVALENLEHSDKLMKKIRYRSPEKLFEKLLKKLLKEHCEKFLETLLGKILEESLGELAVWRSFLKVILKNYLRFLNFCTFWGCFLLAELCKVLLDTSLMFFKRIYTDITGKITDAILFKLLDEFL